MIINLITLHGQDMNKIIDLRGMWKFSIGLSEEWKNYSFDDSDWESIKAPSPWENQGFYGYNGYACYRKKVEVPSKYKGYIFYLDLGYIDDVDEVYFNGELVGNTGSFPPHFTTAYKANRVYYLSEELIRFDKENVISVKVYDTQKEGGIIGGNIGIYVSGMPIKLDINLQGKWKFRTGDHSNYKDPEYSDNSWDEIFVPSYWENQGFKDYDGYAWYRKSFRLTQNLPDDQLFILLGKIDDIDEVYINGELIGSTGDFNQNGSHDNTWKALRGYYFPKSLLKTNGENVISIRIRDFYQGGGIYEGPVGIVTQEKYIEYWRNKKMSQW